MPPDPEPPTRYRTVARLLFAGWLIGMMAAYVLLERRPDLGLAVFVLTWIAFVGGMVWNAVQRRS